MERMPNKSSQKRRDELISYMNNFLGSVLTLAFSLKPTSLALLIDVAYGRPLMHEEGFGHHFAKTEQKLR